MLSKLEQKRLREEGSPSSLSLLSFFIVLFFVCVISSLGKEARP